jgi:NDP-4-keto-2,6-dideoxyhexose 3-C-methyltransferase
MTSLMDRPFDERTACRICGSRDLVSILSFGDMYVSGFVEADANDTIAAPMNLVLCNRDTGGCGLLQLAHTVPGELLYRHYWYRSVTNDSMRRELAEITRRAEELVPLSAGDIVLDIGCNDGTLLRSYQTRGIRLAGFEPAENLVVFARQGTDQVLNEFFNAAAYKTAFGEQKARVITTIAMFYDLDRPADVVSGIASCLAADGVWINQMAYLPLMLERNAFDNICHEHLTYYSLSTLERLYAAAGLEVFDIELNEVNGGSFRIYARHQGSDVGGSDEFRRARVAALEQFEESLNLDGREIYDRFAERVLRIKDELNQFLRSAVADGKKVYGYGASTKGNTLLQFFGLDDSVITAIAERNPEKWGKRTVATNIPIISEEQARRERPDYMLVLPWHFLPGFVEREREYLAAGGHFVVPLPRVRVIGS